MPKKPPKKLYRVPVQLTFAGHVTVEAKDAEAATEKALRGELPVTLPFCELVVRTVAGEPEEV